MKRKGLTDALCYSVLFLQNPQKLPETKLHNVRFGCFFMCAVFVEEVVISVDLGPFLNAFCFVVAEQQTLIETKLLNFNSFFISLSLNHGGFHSLVLLFNAFCFVIVV